MGPTFKYKCVLVDLDSQTNGSASLNELGEKGWRLKFVKSNRVIGQGNKYLCIYEKVRYVRDGLEDKT